MKPQTKECMLNILSEHVQCKELSVSHGDYCRDIEFLALDVHLRINWWVNVSYLFINNIQIPFTRIDIDSCWPNKFTNINFYNKSEKVAIVPIK